MKWTKVLRNGARGVRFMGVDLNTIMFNMERGQDMTEEFALNQPEAYEIKIGDQVFRRPGDPLLEEVVEKLQNEKKRVENDSPAERNCSYTPEIAMKWTEVLRTGALGVRFMGVDLNTIMFNMGRGQDTTEEFALNQPEAYEIKIGDQFFRRPVVEKLQNEKKRVENASLAESNRHLKEELLLCL
ncbi:hypothetical protein ACE6H2_007820 [Prunus campanulata]